MRNSRRVVLFLSLASVFAAPSLSAMAQQPANQQLAGPVIAADGARKATIITFQRELFDVPVARYDYYLSRGSCYYRNPSGQYGPVAPGYCS